MDERDQLIAAAIAASPDTPERDATFADCVARSIHRKRASRTLANRAISAVVLILGVLAATVIFELVNNATGALGSAPLSIVLLTTFGTFAALLFRELAQFALER